MKKQGLTEIIADQKYTLKKIKIIERGIEKNFADDSSFISIFSGIRRSGKSVLLQKIRQQNKEQDYFFNFDDERLIDFTVSDFQKLHEVFLEYFGEQKTFYFDEIQNISGWERFIRRLHDAGSKIYITGSNAHLLSKELGTHLTGRFIQTEIYPFSFKEFLLLRKYDYEKKNIHSVVEKSKMKRYFSEYLSSGGFPEFLSSGNRGYLSSLYESILYRDIVVRHHLPRVKIIQELAIFCASNIGKPITFLSIKKMLGAGSSTSIKEYLEYFEDSYLFFSLSRFSYSLKKQMYAPKKVYCIDTALAQTVGFRFTQDKGRYLENIIFLELKRRGKDIYYHSDKKECDFVIKEGMKIAMAVQVSTDIEDEKTKERELGGLREAMEEYNLLEGFLITEESEEEEEVLIRGKRGVIRIIPAWKWLLES